MALITNLDPTTETEAVNAMLSAIGESPVSDATAAATQVDVAMALNILRNTTRELQTGHWRFNFAPGLQVAPTATLSWTDRANVTTTLNVFKEPRFVSSWKMTRCAENGDLDLVPRLSSQYQEGAANVVILCDRTYHRDGAEATRYPFVYIDAVLRFDFQYLPETARRLITITSARRFCHQVLGSAEKGSFAEEDEALARHFFQQEQGESDDYNMLNSVEAFNMRGRRSVGVGGTWVQVRPGRTSAVSGGGGGGGGGGGTVGGGGEIEIPL